MSGAGFPPVFRLLPEEQGAQALVLLSPEVLGLLLRTLLVLWENSPVPAEQLAYAEIRALYAQYPEAAPPPAVPEPAHAS